MNAAHTACLFGGTLIAAGIASSASATFTIGQTTNGSLFPTDPGATVSGYAGNGSYTFSYDTSAEFGETSASVSFATGTSSTVTISSGEISGTTTKGPPSFTLFNFATQFTVAQDVDVRVQWSADPTINSSFDYDFRIHTGTNRNDTVFLADVLNNTRSGDVTLSLQAGVNYTAVGAYRSTYAREAGFFSITASEIPAPGAAAMLPIAGAFAARRRR